MFTAKTEKIAKIAENKQEVIKQLEDIFSAKTRIYIDYANVRPWSSKLGWHIELKRLNQFLSSFDTIDVINFYNGYLAGDERSEKEKKEAENCKFILRTKPVKIMDFSINSSSILPDSIVLLDQFVKRALLKQYEISTIEYLNDRFKDMNKKGIYSIKDMKCNFDVEIGMDMLMDHEHDNAETFVLWSGDSDFTDPIEKLMSTGRKVTLFATARKVSRELSALVPKGLMIFDIQKIRDFICWKRELEERKGDPREEAPKL